ncbi:MAG: hypothetical protein H7Y86_19205 [Rhizobacter sp.]|nr:hypothetical protein [Ferruginibacter sp.]
MLKLKNLILYSLVFLLLIITPRVNACTIFMANDGQHVWIGNNEDERQQLKYRLWYYPAKNHYYGYAIWTESAPGSILNGFYYLNPQGGLNEHGLYMDYTATDPITPFKDKKKKDRKKQPVTDLLKTCKTVEEALLYLSKYNLVKLTDAQLFIGDANGDYAIVNGSYIVRKKVNSFALTNYCINEGHTQACHRRDVATHYLNTTTTFERRDIENILEKSTQKLPNNLVSNYSMAVNLKTRTIYLYYKNDFSTVFLLDLATALKKGKHHKNMEDYFPKSIAPVLEQAFKRTGVDAALDKYKVLRTTAGNTYNFKNDHVLNLAINWLEKGQTNDAIKLLECLNTFQPLNAHIYAWLGVAWRKKNNMIESNKHFAKALEMDPDNYVATLFGKQENQQVIFNLPDFEAAEQVWLMGDFTGWTKHPVKMRKYKGGWACEIKLPKGEVRYKFIVNDQYLADSKNFLHTGQGAGIFSKLYVW